MARWTVRIFEETTLHVPSNIGFSERITQDMNVLNKFSKDEVFFCNQIDVIRFFFSLDTIATQATLTGLN